MDFWTWVVPLAAFLGGVILSQQSHNETKGELSNAREREKRLGDELDDARRDIAHQVEIGEMWERIARERSCLSDRGERYGEVLGLLKHSRAKAKTSHDAPSD